MQLEKRDMLVLGGLGLLLARQALQSRHSFDFRGKAVVVTGGSRGFGLVIARQLADQGANLTLVARDPQELKLALDDIERRGTRAIMVVGDIGDRGVAEQAIDSTISAYGRVDVLINNAGIIQAGPIDHMTIKDFEDAMAVHLWGPLYTTLAALPQMRRQGGGRIVNIASIGGKLAVPHLIPYSASKFALVGLSDGLRAELAQDNILVTTVSPGLLRTGSHLNALFKGQHAREFAWFALSDSLPLTSINAERAAHQVVEACRTGRPDLVITTQARAATIVQALLPNLTAELMKLAARLLPGPVSDGDGDVVRSGWQSRSSLVPAFATRLSDQAAIENNELRGHAPPGE